MHPAIVEGMIHSVWSLFFASFIVYGLLKLVRHVTGWCLLGCGKKWQ